MRRRILSTLASWLVALVTWAAAPAPAAEALPASVERLVEQLDAPQLARREAAQEQLEKLGPAVLPLLPENRDVTSAEVRARLDRLRQRLQQQSARTALAGAAITLEAREMPLADVLAALAKQSGNALVDYRERFGQKPTNPPLDVAFRQTPFWEALDTVLDQAQLSVYPFGESQAISVVARGQQVPRQQGVYRGPFRLEPVSILAQRDLREPRNRSLRLTVEIAWEPRLKPINFQQRLADLTISDDSGQPLAVGDTQATLELPVKPGLATAEMVLPLALPRRGQQSIARLDGVLQVQMPGPVEEFRFEHAGASRRAEKRIAQAAVNLDEVHKSGSVWEVRMRVRFDAAGDALDSYRGWIFQNPAYLVAPDGTKKSYGALETTRQTKNEVGIAYHFEVGPDPPDFAFVYETPAAITLLKIDYRFENIPLP